MLISGLLPKDLAVSVFRHDRLVAVVQDLGQIPIADAVAHLGDATFAIGHDGLCQPPTSWPAAKILGGPTAFVEPTVLPLVRADNGNGAPPVVPRPEPDRQARSIAGVPRGPITLLTHPGLGDVVFALPVAYALAAAGYKPSIAYEDLPNTTKPVVGELPHLPLVAPYDPGAPVLCLEYERGFDWHAGGPMLDQVCWRLGIPLAGTPRTACLQDQPWYADYRHMLTNGRPYVVIAPYGNCNPTQKNMAYGQISAAADAAHAIGCIPVLVSHSVVDTPPGTINLGGRTSIAELCAIVSGARIAVTTDTGILHLAGAFGTPIVGVFQPSEPRSVLMDYAPVLSVRGGKPGQVPPASIVAAIWRMDAALSYPWRVSVPARRTCGIASHGRRVAAAAGVPCVTLSLEDPEWVTVYEYYERPDALPRYLPERTVLSMHRQEAPLPPCAGAVAYSRYYYERHARSGRVWQTCLPTRNGGSARRLPERPTVICWHGIALGIKGVPLLAEAVRLLRERAVPHARLILLPSIPEDRPEYETMAYLRHLSDPWVDVDLRPYWTEDELVERMREADLFAYLDSIDGEQSGCSTDALGFGRPVVVSKSSKHDPVRSWCVTVDAFPPTVEAVAYHLWRVMTEHHLYVEAAKRAEMGAHCMDVGMVARLYRGAAVQAVLDGHLERQHAHKS